MSAPISPSNVLVRPDTPTISPVLRRHNAAMTQWAISVSKAMDLMTHTTDAETAALEEDISISTLMTPTDSKHGGGVDTTPSSSTSGNEDDNVAPVKRAKIMPPLERSPTNRERTLEEAIHSLSNQIHYINEKTSLDFDDVMDRFKRMFNEIMRRVEAIERYCDTKL